jgi:hypothetical protein
MTRRPPNTGATRAPQPGASRGVSIVVWTVSAIAVVLVLLNQTGTADLNGTVSNLAPALELAVGAMLVIRVPRNRVGWLLWLGGVLIAISIGTGGIAVDGLVTSPGKIPGAIWLAWLSGVTGYPGFVIAAGFLPLVYPSGRLPSPRWRAVVVVGVIATLLVILESAFGPFPAGSYPPSAQNPVQITGPAGDAIAVLGSLGSAPGIGVLIAAAAISIVVRYRRSVGVEREQIKWFAYVAAIVIAALVVAGLSGSWVAWLVVLTGLALLPVAIGIAVLRYRLYDIDVVIRRTLVYAVLAGLLAVAYGGSVLLLSALLAPLTSQNSLAVAGSTLLVAALFQPVRGRVKSIVDRRFYRSRYDAKQELAELGQRLLGEVDLEGVRSDVVATIGRTLQPASVSVWLRTETGPEPR